MTFAASRKMLARLGRQQRQAVLGSAISEVRKEIEFLNSIRFAIDGQTDADDLTAARRKLRKLETLAKDYGVGVEN